MTLLLITALWSSTSIALASSDIPKSCPESYRLLWAYPESDRTFNNQRYALKNKILLEQKERSKVRIEERLSLHEMSMQHRTLPEAINRFLGGDLSRVRMRASSGKIQYSEDLSPYFIIEDVSGEYFRVFNLETMSHVDWQGVPAGNAKSHFSYSSRTKANLPPDKDPPLASNYSNHKSAKIELNDLIEKVSVKEVFDEVLEVRTDRQISDQVRTEIVNWANQHPLLKNWALRNLLEVATFSPHPDWLPILRRISKWKNSADPLEQGLAATADNLRFKIISQSKPGLASKIDGVYSRLLDPRASERSRVQLLEGISDGQPLSPERSNLLLENIDRFKSGREITQLLRIAKKSRDPQWLPKLEEWLSRWQRDVMPWRAWDILQAYEAIREIRSSNRMTYLNQLPAYYITGVKVRALRLELLRNLKTALLSRDDRDELMYYLNKGISREEAGAVNKLLGGAPTKR